MPAGERVAQVKIKADSVAKEQGWAKNNNLSKQNNRTVYTDKATGTHYSVDTQHGHFEVLDHKGKHQGAINMDLKHLPGSVDPSGGHNLKI